MKILAQVSELYGTGYPKISTLISETPIDEKQCVLSYLRNGTHTSESPAKVRDVITGESINERLSMQSDGVYAWRSDIAYYFDKYNIDLGNDFINHVLKSK